MALPGHDSLRYHLLHSLLRIIALRFDNTSLRYSQVLLQLNTELE